MPSEAASKKRFVAVRDTGRSRAVGALAVTAVVLAGFVALALTALSGSDVYAAYGLPNPGDVTRYGLPIVRVIAEAGAVLCVGSLLLLAFGIPAERSGMLTADGFAAVRAAGWAASVWAVGAVLVVPFTAADATGRPIGEVLQPAALMASLSALGEAQAWTLTAVIALVLAIASRMVLSWGWSVGLFLGALAGLFPLIATGHSSSGGSHDLATTSLLYHLFGATLWVGGLVALLAHAARGGAHLALVTRRFSSIALVCWIAMAASGVVNTLVRVQVGQLLSTTYGALVLIKLCLLGALGGIGYLQRRRAVRRVQDSASAGAGLLLRLGAVEMLIMFATIGVAVALGRTPPPATSAVLSKVALLIGYDLDGPPTLARMLFDWRFDLLYGTLSLVLAASYLWGVLRLRLRGDRWSAGRMTAWLCGCATLLVATSSGIGKYAPAMFSVHMAQHMMLSMLTPALLVLGGPMSLALRVLRPASRAEPPGPREWLLAFVHSPVTRALTHPVLALALFVGSFYLLYFSGLFDAALYEHWAHLLMNAHFLLVGYLFFWLVIGVDPAPRRLPALGKLGLVFASMPFHAFFGIALMMSQYVIGQYFYAGLALPWVPDLLADQRLGGGLAWASGEVPLILVMIALALQWCLADQRAARREDRRAARDGDAELAAYNAMLRQLSEGDGRSAGG